MGFPISPHLLRLMLCGMGVGPRYLINIYGLSLQKQAFSALKSLFSGVKSLL